MGVTMNEEKTSGDSLRRAYVEVSLELVEEVLFKNAVKIVGVLPYDYMDHQCKRIRFVVQSSSFPELRSDQTPPTASTIVHTETTISYIKVGVA